MKIKSRFASNAPELTFLSMPSSILVSVVFLYFYSVDTILGVRTQ